MFRHESGPSMSSVLDTLSLEFVGAGQMWEASGWGKTGAHRQVRTENVDWRLAAITEAGCSDLSRGQPHLRPRTCEAHLPRTPARRVARAPPRLLPRLPCVRAHSVPAGLLRRALPGPRRALRPFLPRGPSSPILAPSAVLSETCPLGHTRVQRPSLPLLSPTGLSPGTALPRPGPCRGPLLGEAELTLGSSMGR